MNHPGKVAPLRADLEETPSKSQEAPVPRTTANAPSIIPEEPSEDEFRERILNAIPVGDDESITSRTKKVSSVCARILKIKYEEVQPMFQAGLGLLLDHWGQIHRQLEAGDHVEAREARETALAIDNMLSLAPTCRWQLTRKINRNHFLELQAAGDGPIREGPLRTACLKGFNFIVSEYQQEKDHHRFFLQQTAEVILGKNPGIGQRPDIQLARRCSREILEDPRIQERKEGSH